MKSNKNLKILELHLLVKLVQVWFMCLCVCVQVES